MKNKIVIGIFLTIFIFMSIFNFNINVYAATDSNKFVEISVPNKYEQLSRDETDTDIWVSYVSAVDEQYYTYIHYDVFERFSTEIKYTKEDADEIINVAKETASRTGDSVKEIYTGLIENNGCLGMRIAYKYYYTQLNEAYYMDSYYFLTDNYDVRLEFRTFNPNYINSTDHKQIVKSLKIKDTVLKSRGIPFTDVPSNSWYEGAVKYVYNNNIIKGTNAYTFAPEDKLTRGMLVTILHRMEGMPYVSGESKFSDVKDTNAYYYVAVKWATSNKIVSGYDNGRFGPNDSITREQLAVMLNNYCRYKGKYKTVNANLTKFKDASKISSYAKWGMNWAVGSGVITGSNGYLNPQGTATRAEAASMIYKYCLNIK